MCALRSALRVVTCSLLPAFCRSADDTLVGPHTWPRCFAVCPVWLTASLSLRWQSCDRCWVLLSVAARVGSRDLLRHSCNCFDRSSHRKDGRDNLSPVALCPTSETKVSKEASKKWQRLTRRLWRHAATSLWGVWWGHLSPTSWF